MKYEMGFMGEGQVSVFSSLTIPFSCIIYCRCFWLLYQKSVDCTGVDYFQDLDSFPPVSVSIFLLLSRCFSYNSSITMSWNLVLWLFPTFFMLKIVLAIWGSSNFFFPIFQWVYYLVNKNTTDFCALILYLSFLSVLTFC